jgi:serine/threonine-protein kinase ATR
MVRELLAMSERETPEGEFILSLKKHFGGLARLVPSKLIMPLQEYLTVNLPPSSLTKDTHQPFPSNIPTFYSKSAQFQRVSRRSHLVIQNSTMKSKS